MPPQRSPVVECPMCPWPRRMQIRHSCSQHCSSQRATEREGTKNQCRPKQRANWLQMQLSFSHFASPCHVSGRAECGLESGEGRAMGGRGRALGSLVDLSSLRSALCLQSESRA